MGFKKLTLNDLKYALYENLIGLPQSSGEIQENNITFLDNSRNIGRSKIPENGSSNYSIFKGKKVLISLNTTRKITIDNNYDIKEDQGENWILVRNPSEQNRIWNISLMMSSLKEAILLDGLEPGEEMRKEIELNQKEEDPELKIIEKISKKGYIKDLDESSNYYLESNKRNFLFFTIFIKNISDHPLSSIQIEKILPETTQKIIESSTDLGSIQTTRKKILLSIEKLDPFQNAVLKFKVELPEMRSNTGKFFIQYKTSSINIENINVKNFTANINTAQFLHTNEKDEFPGIWDCGLSIVNQSDLELNVSEIKLFTVLNNESTLIEEINNKIEIDPYQEKTLIEKTLKSTVQPVLKKEISYQLGFQKTNSRLVIIEIEDSSIEIIDISAEMNFSVDSIRSYEKTEFDALIDILNNSSLPINHLMVKLNFPKDFSYENVGDLMIKLGKKKNSLNEFSKNLEIMNPEEELILLTKKVADLTNYIKIISDKKENLESSRGELQKVLQVFDESQLSKKKDNYSGQLNNLNKELEKNLQLKVNCEKTIDNLNVQLKNLEENKVKLLENKMEIEKIEKINENIHDQEKLIGQIEDKIKKYQKEIQDLEKKNIEKNMEIGESNNINPKIKNLNKKIEDLSKKKQKNLNTLKNLEKEIKQIEKKSENKQPKSKIEEDLKDLEEKRAVLQKELKTQLQTSNDVNLTITSTESKISNAEVRNKEINNSLLKSQETKKELSVIEEKIIDIDKEFKIKTEQLEISEKRKNKLGNIYDSNLQYEQRFSFIKKEFADGIKDNENVQFETFFLTDNFRQNNLVIILNNLQKIIGEIKPKKKFKLKIPITAIRPKIDTNYEYSTEIFYDYMKSSGILRYIVSPEKIGSLKIEHKRKKISLGKIVNPLQKKNQFSISLIIKNNGRNSVENMKILDFLPQKTEISNSYFAYKEEKFENDLKKISWEINKILPGQEFEISYVATLSDSNFDLYSFELKTE